MAATERTIEVDAPREALYRVVTDYEAYPRFLPEMVSVEVLSRAGGRVEARFHLHIVKDLRYTLSLVEDGVGQVSWTLVSGDLRENVGSWTLESLGPARCRATYSVRLEVGIFVPGAILGRLLGEQLSAMLAAFAARAEEQGP